MFMLWGESNLSRHEALATTALRNIRSFSTLWPAHTPQQEGSNSDGTKQPPSAQPGPSSTDAGRRTQGRPRGKAPAAFQHSRPRRHCPSEPGNAPKVRSTARLLSYQQRSSAIS